MVDFTECKTITSMFEKIAEEMCDKFCRYTHEGAPHGKPDDWLIEDEESPCRECPLNIL